MRGWILDVSIIVISYKMVSVDRSDCMGGEGENHDESMQQQVS